MSSYMLEENASDRAVIDAIIQETVSVKTENPSSFNAIDDCVLSQIVQAQAQIEATEISAVLDEPDASTTEDQETASPSSQYEIFKGKVMFLSREVPRYSLEFVLRAFGGVVCWPESSGAGSPMSENDDRITHVIIDRPLESVTLRADRIYVQPQWVFDSINSGYMVTEELFSPGKILPPHLSPFMAYDATHGFGEDGPILETKEDASSAELMVDGDQIELEAEAKGVPFSEFDQRAAVEKAERDKKIAQKQTKAKQENEKVEMAKMIMSNKKRKLLERVQAADAKVNAKVMIYTFPVINSL
jgi:pescadillo protein